MEAELVREWSREEIVELLEIESSERRSMTASEFIGAWRDGSLDEAGEVADLLALVFLLPDDDPLFGERS